MMHSVLARRSSVLRGRFHGWLPALAGLCVAVAACGSPESSAPTKTSPPTEPAAPAKPAAAEPKAVERPTPAPTPAPKPVAPVEAAAPKAASPAAGAAAVAAVAAEASQLFAGRCAVCHGPEGKGDGPTAVAMDPKPRDFSEADWQASVTDADITNAIVNGGAAIGKSPLMPPNPDLAAKPDVVKALVARIRAVGKP